VPNPIVAVAATTAGSAAVGKRSADKAARAQTQASDAAVGEQRRQFDLTRSDQMPWLDAGRNALADLENPNAFQTDPGYNFLRTEGQRGIEQSSAARGGASSGNALKALAEFNTNLANSSYGDWWNRKASVAGVGQTAAQNLGVLGANTASNVGNALMAGGNARASGIIGGANAISQGVSSGIDAWRYFRDPNQGGGFGGGGGGFGGYGGPWGWRTPPINPNYGYG
jgi:hypothetical protein